MKYELAHHSLTGARSSNQDRVAYIERNNAVLLVLADGLGGHAGGELAAEIATDTAARALGAVKQPIISKPSAFLALTMLQAHKALQAIGPTRQPPITPRTTCVMCLVQNGYAYWAHVGDSRLYHFRDNRLLTRTLDHTSIEQLQMDGLLTEEEMHTHPHKSALLKCLGGGTAPSVTLGEETLLYRHDTLLLCSDGLWEAFTPEEIAAYLARDALEEALEDMLLAAEEKMAQRSDNTTAIVLRWRDGVSSSLPLQRPLGAGDNSRAMLASAAKDSARKKMRESASVDDGSFEKSIKELEVLLKKFGPKS